jgi:hypothetical protein
MGRSALAAAFTVVFVVVASGSACTDTGSSNVTRPDGGTPCQAGDTTCASNELCSNRTCVPTCPGGASCMPGMYCAGATSPSDVCAPITVTTCTGNQDCPNPQLCFQGGLCASLELRADGGVQPCANDDSNCAPDAICLPLATNTGSINENCVGMPACSQDGGCPIGLFGSVCNDLPDGGKIVANKQRICLFPKCLVDTNCNPQSHCFRTVIGSVAGECFYGVTGDPCYAKPDCLNATDCVDSSDGGVLQSGVLGVCK